MSSALFALEQIGPEEKNRERNLTGNNPMEEELCLVDSATTNTIPREKNTYKLLLRERKML
jgi:hypothetical protein